MSKYDIIPPVAKQHTPAEKQQEPETQAINYPEEENIFVDTNLGIQTLQSALQTSVQKEQQIKKDNTDTRFWFAVYFQDADQKNEFLKKVGAQHITAGQYIDGLELAKVLGIDLPKKEKRIPGKFKTFKL